MAETHFLGEEGQDLCSRLTPEAEARIEAMLGDPEFQPESKEFNRGADPLGMNWAWADPPEDQHQARQQADNHAQQLVEDPRFGRLLGDLFDASDDSLQKLLLDADFQSALHHLLRTAGKVIRASD